MAKVTYIENGKEIVREFTNEDMAKVFKAELKNKGIKGKWEW
jgi:hypothetical protein